MVKLRRLRITRYSDVAPCDLRFDDGVNVVLGINGSGKTTLLRLLADLLSWRFETTLADVDVRWTVEVAGWTLDLSFAAAPDEEARFVLETTSDAVAGPHRVVLVRDVQGWRRIDGGGVVSASVKAYLYWTDEVAEGVALPNELFAAGTRLDEGLDFFRALTADSGDATRIRVRSGDGSAEARVGVLGSATAAAFVERLPTRETEIRLDHHALPWLRRARDLFEYDRAEAVWRVVDRRVEGGKEHLDFGPMDVLFERGDRSVAASRLSFGQMRMLAYQYYLDVHREVVIADELVNGLHHAWVRACLEDIGDRQAFLTSQNPILFNELDLASPEQIGRCIVACRLEERDGRRVMLWSNLTDDDAKEVFLAKDVGIESTSDILISRGLW